MLQRVRGPECLKCGCTDSREIGQTTRWGQVSIRRRCNHCGWTWSAVVEPAEAELEEAEPAAEAEEAAPPEADDGTGLAAEYSSVRCRCPVCAAPNPKVQSTRPTTELGSKFRQHKCSECGYTFQSRERVESEE